MSQLFMLGVGIVALSIGIHGWYQERATKDAQNANDGWEKHDKYTRFMVLDLECAMCNKLHNAALQADFRPLWWLPSWVRERVLKAIVPKAVYSCGCEGYVDDVGINDVARQFIRFVAVPVHCLDCNEQNHCIVEVSFERLRWLPWRLRLLVVGSIIRCVMYHCGCSTETTQSAI